MKYYEFWDGGNFKMAKQLGRGIEQDVGAFAQPSAVTELGDVWFETETSSLEFKSKPRDFYGHEDKVKVYVCDELARIRRLIHCNEDCRSAFLRAGNVNEIIMLARVVTLVTDTCDRSSLLNALDECTPRARAVFEALIEPEKTFINVKNDIPFRNAPDLPIPRSAPMNSWWRATNLFNTDNGWEVFLNRRNDLIHKYFSVPREWAKDALKFVQANFEDFLGYPMTELHIQTTALAWPELSGLCGTDRFLPPNLRKEAQL